MDEDLAECSVWARLLFPALWQLADREGRLEDRPAMIRIHAFPYDNLEAVGVSVNDLLGELARPREHCPEGGGFILRYVVAGRAYIQIKNFKSHQRPHPNEVDSQLPVPPSETARTTKVDRDNEKDDSARAKPSGSSKPSGPSSRLAPETPVAVVSDVAKVRAELVGALTAVATVTGRPADELLAECSSTPRGQAFTNPEACTSVPWMRTTIERLVTLRLRGQAKARDRPGPSPAEAVASEPEWANLETHVTAFLAWYTENPEAGMHGGRSGVHGAAYGAWTTGKGLPESIKAAVWREASARLQASDRKRRVG